MLVSSIISKRRRRLTLLFPTRLESTVVFGAHQVKGIDLLMPPAIASTVTFGAHTLDITKRYLNPPLLQANVQFGVHRMMKRVYTPAFTDPPTFGAHAIFNIAPGTQQIFPPLLQATPTFGAHRMMKKLYAPAFTDPPTFGAHALVKATSYSNELGTGNRTASITVAGVGKTTGGGTLSNAVDGATTNTTTDSWWWLNGETGWVLYFDFRPSGFSRIIDEIRWKQSTTATHGDWTIEGWDGLSWTQLKSSFTLGGSTSQTITFANTNPYQIYRLTQASGSTSNAPWLQEVEFKIARGDALSEASTSYANTYGSGNRSAIITVSTTATLSSGTIGTLVDGTTGSGGCIFNSAQSGREIKFDFGSGNAKIVNELKWYGSNNTNHGTWKLQGSNDDNAWDDLGISFVLNGPAGGGATTYAQMAYNRQSYRYYRLLQIASTTSGSPTNWETEFKVSA